MPRLSTLSNPTGLLELDRNRIKIHVDEQGDSRSLSLAQLDVSNLNGLPAGLQVVVIASRGNSEERVELGPLSDWNKAFVKLAEIGAEGPWTFRVLLVRPGESRLIAVAEGVRPAGQGDAESFIALEAADLGQVPWDIYVLEQEGRAVIRFNKDVYISSGEVSADAAFIALVLPEAIRRVSEQVCREPGCLEDENWRPFKEWLVVHGVDPDLDENATDEEKATWCGSVVKAFCDRFEMANSLKELRSRRGEE